MNLAELKRRLARLGDESLRFGVGRRIDVHTSDAVRRSVAKTTAGPDLLNRLAVDPVGSVALWVSENPAAIDAALELQERHPDDLARQRAREQMLRRASL